MEENKVVDTNTDNTIDQKTNKLIIAYKKLMPDARLANFNKMRKMQLKKKRDQRRKTMNKVRPLMARFFFDSPKEDGELGL